MFLFGWMLSALTLVGCNKDKGGEETGGGDTGGGSGCGVSISSTDPAADEAIYYRDTLSVTFSAEDSTATAMVMDSSGAEVSGSTSWSDDNLTLYFTPDAPLTPSSQYTLSITYCSGTPEVPFSTTELGGEVDSASLVGMAYVIDLGSANFIEPAGIGPILTSVLTQNILVGVTGVTDTEVDMVGAISLEGSTEQDVCTPSIAFPTADFSENPHFNVGPEDTTISVAGYSATIRGLEISGDFAPDLSYFGEGVLAGTIDSRDLATIPDLQDLTGCDGTNDACLCDFIQSSGLATCSECSDGEPLCLTLLADSIVADSTGSSLVVVTEDDIAANPECAE